MASHWFSDKIVLKMYGARNRRQDHPAFYGMVRGLALKANCLPGSPLFSIPTPSQLDNPSTRLSPQRTRYLRILAGRLEGSWPTNWPMYGTGTSGGNHYSHLCRCYLLLGNMLSGERYWARGYNDDEGRRPLIGSRLWRSSPHCRHADQMAVSRSQECLAGRRRGSAAVLSPANALKHTASPYS
jgi:heat shock protein HtpX